MTESEDFLRGYIQGVTAVFDSILGEMDDELKDIVLNHLKVKKV